MAGRDVLWSVFSAVLHIYKLQEGLFGFHQLPPTQNVWAQQLLNFWLLKWGISCSVNLIQACRCLCPSVTRCTNSPQSAQSSFILSSSNSEAAVLDNNVLILQINRSFLLIPFNHIFAFGLFSREHFGFVHPKMSEYAEMLLWHIIHERGCSAEPHALCSVGPTFTVCHACPCDLCFFFFSYSSPQLKISPNRLFVP